MENAKKKGSNDVGDIDHGDSSEPTAAMPDTIVATVRTTAAAITTTMPTTTMAMATTTVGATTNNLPSRPGSPTGWLQFTTPWPKVVTPWPQMSAQVAAQAYKWTGHPWQNPFLNKTQPWPNPFLNNTMMQKQFPGMLHPTWPPNSKMPPVWTGTWQQNAFPGTMVRGSDQTQQYGPFAPGGTMSAVPRVVKMNNKPITPGGTMSAVPVIPVAVPPRPMPIPVPFPMPVPFAWPVAVQTAPIAAQGMRVLVPGGSVVPVA